jgi:rhodanese-related sulfurtransferase
MAGMDPVSIVALPNFRDLCGLRSAGVPYIRPGRLMRSATLCALPGPAAAALEAATGPGVYLDLRTEAEIDRDGAPDALIAAGWTWRRVPMQDKKPGDLSDAAEDCLRRYRAELLGYLAIARQAVGLLAERPVLVACSLGKDRTGLVIALLLRWLGVCRADIVADFVQSNRELAAGRHLLPPRWRDEAVPISRVVGWVCTEILDTLDTFGPIADLSVHEARKLAVLTAAASVEEVR